MKNEANRVNLTARKKVSNPDNIRQRTTHRTLHLISLGALFFVVASLLAVPILSLALDSLYADTVLPGVRLGASTPLGGLARDDVRAIVESYRQRMNEKGLLYRLGARESRILPYPLAFNSDIPLEQIPPIITIDSDATFDRAFAIGRDSTFASNLRSRVNLLTKDVAISPVFTVNEAALKEAIQKEFASEQQEPLDAYFVLSADEKTVEIIPEKEGYAIDSDLSVAQTMQQISGLVDPSVMLTLVPVQASVTRHDAAYVLDRVYAIIAAYPYRLHVKEKTYTPEKNEILRWLTIVQENGELPHIALNTDTVRSYLESKVAPDISIAIQQQKYEIKHGKVTTFQHARDGQELDRDQSIFAIESALLNTVPTPAIELRSKQIPALPSDMDGETLVLKEIIGRGVTDFRGSPPNRRHNIANGIKQINGIIIKNGETFSLVSALGSIDDTGGYKPELVIKGTKTIPEYGGGLCQVSTTLFRAVAYAGLPIVERKNHSYRVSYYEPPIGFDATIYSPKPDFRFTNDTGYPILIQARVEGTKVSVDLWGVNDGRRVEVDEPTVFNIKKAPPVRYIETSDLKPGEKKCTERAHDGADAVFERRVYPVSGEMKKDIFKSHYVVWPAVCLVGEEQKEPQDIPAEKSDTDTVEQP